MIFNLYWAHRIGSNFNRTANEWPSSVRRSRYLSRTLCAVISSRRSERWRCTGIDKALWWGHKVIDASTRRELNLLLMVAQDKFLVMCVNELFENLVVLLLDCTSLQRDLTMLGLLFPDHSAYVSIPLLNWVLKILDIFKLGLLQEFHFEHVTLLLRQFHNLLINELYLVLHIFKS